MRSRAGPGRDLSGVNGQVGGWNAVNDIQIAGRTIKLFLGLDRDVPVPGAVVPVADQALSRLCVDGVDQARRQSARGGNMDRDDLHGRSV